MANIDQPLAARVAFTVEVIVPGFQPGEGVLEELLRAGFVLGVW